MSLRDYVARHMGYQPPSASGKDTLYHFGRALCSQQFSATARVQRQRTAAPQVGDTSVRGCTCRDNNHSEWNALFALYHVPPFVPASADVALSFGLGVSSVNSRTKSHCLLSLQPLTLVD